MVAVLGCGADGSFATSGGTGASIALAIDDGFLYWFDGAGSIVRAPRGGGSPMPIAIASGTDGELRVNATTVVWREEAGTDLNWAPKSSGATTLVGLAPSRAIQFSVDDERVYYGRSKALIEHTIASAADRVLFEDQFVLSVIPEGDDLIGTSCETTGVGDFGIWRIPRAGGARESVVVDGCPQAITADDDFLYVIEQGVIRISKRGGEPVQLSDDASLVFAVRDGVVYFTDLDRTRIFAMPASGGTPSMLVTASVLGLAVDDTTLYWTELVGTTVELRSQPLP